MRIIENASILRRKIFVDQSERSKKIITSASHSFVVKALSIISGFLLVSLSISCLNVENYGVWLTISSVITWINLFDIGLVSSLRNRITETLAFGDWDAAQKYTSTTYALLLLIIAPTWVVFFCLSPYLNWQSIFNTSVSNTTLESVVLCVFTSFCLQFSLKPVVSVLTADQKHFLVNSIYLLNNVLSIAFLLWFKRQLSGSLFWVSFLFGAVPCLVLGIVSLLLFQRKYKALCPTVATIDFGRRKDLLGLGFKFFIIQVAGLIIFSSNNFIISQLLGNEQVTYYNIVFRYFSVITIGYSLVNAPFWTAYTDAYAVKDWAWIRKVTRQANQLCTVLLVVTLVMLLVSDRVYRIWINDSIKIPFALSALVALNAVLGLYGSTYTSFINGTGKIRLQSYLCILVSLCHAPIAYFLIKSLGLGLYGLMLLTAVWTLVSLILWSIQYKKIINRADGYIWN